MNYWDINFKHYDIDADVEKLIEMWVFYNPKDEPYPINEHLLYLNEKNKEITPYQLLFNLSYQVFQNSLLKLDTFYRKCFQFKTAKPVEYIYEHFQERFKPKEEKTVEIPEDEKPLKKRKKKE